MHKRLLGLALVALLAVAVGTLSSAGARGSTRGATDTSAANGPRALPVLARLRRAALGQGRYIQYARRGPGTETARAGTSKLPLSFVPNAGQINPLVRYAAAAGSASFYFTAREAVFAFTTKTKGLALRLGFLAANPKPAITAIGRRSGKVNYVIGNDPGRWRTDIPLYAAVAYHDLWPGIDLRFRGSTGRLKYELVLQPGARVRDIRLVYRGATRLSVNAHGDLVIHTSLGDLADTRPVSYQRVAGHLVPVATRFVLGKSSSYGFQIAQYDRRRPLFIDPGIVYSTYLGGTGDETGGDAIAVDPRGNAYVAGDTYSLDFPTTAGAFDMTYNLGEDTVVTKLNRSGSGLVYSTYLGGTSDEPYWSASIAVDPAGYAYVAGTTLSPDFPTTAGAYQRTYAGGFGDAFVTKLNRDGSGLVYSTFLGSSGDDGAYYGDAIAVDPRGNAYVTGFTDSPAFPTKDAYDSTFNGVFDAFVTKLNSSGSDLVYSTYLGGSNDDDATGIAVDPTGEAFVTGYTASTDFPTQNAFQSANRGQYDAFVTKFSSSGNALVYSTYLGGTGFFDGAASIDVDYSGNAATAVVTGDTDSTDFPTTPGALQTAYGGGDDDAFVTKLSNSGSSLTYSTYVGGSGNDYANNVAVDQIGQAHVVGFTNSPDFPTTPGAFQTTFAGAGPPFFYGDAFVSKLDKTGSTLGYSTYLGGAADETGLGIAVDWSGKVYVSGSTNSVDFPTTPGAFDTSYNGAGPPYFYGDAYVSKFDVGAKHVPPFPRTAASDSAESSELAHLNSLRTTALLPPLTLNALSSDVARAHSSDELTQGALSETGSDGSTPATRLRSGGVLFSVNAESLSASVGATSSDALAAIQSDLLGDAMFTANALNPAFTQVGIGVVYVEGVMLLTADFTG